MNTDQIAAEAWATIKRNYGISDTATYITADGDGAAIIQAAIEKAWQDGYVEGSNYQISISHAAHASEPTGQDTKRLDWLLTDAGRTWIYWRGQRKPPRIVNRTTIDAAMSEDLAG